MIDLNNDFWNQQLLLYNNIVNRERVSEWKADVKKIRYCIRSHYTGLHRHESIELILSSGVRDKDNEVIIDYLNGNTDAIWGLYHKYKSYYRQSLKIEIGNYKEGDRSIYDYIMDGFDKVIKDINFGRYKGINFKSWSNKVILYNAINLWYEAKNIKRDHNQK